MSLSSTDALTAICRLLYLITSLIHPLPIGWFDFEDGAKNGMVLYELFNQQNGLHQKAHADRPTVLLATFSNR